MKKKKEKQMLMPRTKSIRNIREKVKKKNEIMRTHDTQDLHGVQQHAYVHGVVDDFILRKFERHYVAICIWLYKSTIYMCSKTLVKINYRILCLS